MEVWVVITVVVEKALSITSSAPRGLRLPCLIFSFFYLNVGLVQYVGDVVVSRASSRT